MLTQTVLQQQHITLVHLLVISSAIITVHAHGDGSMFLRQGCQQQVHRELQASVFASVTLQKFTLLSPQLLPQDK